MTTGFPIISISASLIGDFYNARTAQATLSSFRALSTSPTAFAAQDDAVTAPWQIDDEPRSLARRIGQVRAQDKFIDLSDASVRAAGDDVDARATFALFNALSDLQTLAQYASESPTSERALERLSDQFEKGLAEVRDFLSTQELDKLDLLFGKKTTNASTTVSLGKDTNSYGGKVLQTGAREDVLSGLDGTEAFTISLTKSGETDVFNVDLSGITGDLTMDSVVDYINAEIASLQLVDDEGVPQFDDEGEPIAKYLSRFEVRSDDNRDWLIGIDGTLTETVTLSAPSADPTVYVGSTFNSIVTDRPEFSRVNQLVDGASGLTTGARADVSATSAALTALAEDIASANGDSDEDEETEPLAVATSTGAIAVDSQGFSYVLSTSTGDFNGQLGDGEQDVFLTKLDSQGDVLFSRLLGSAGNSEGFALTVDANDNVIIAGQTDGQVKSSDTIDGQDSFVVKYNSQGDQIFRYQLDTVASDAALALTTNADGDIFVGGYSSGAVNASTSTIGQRDAYVLRLDGATGALSDVTLLGTAANDEVKGLAVDASGNVIAAVEQDGRASVVKLDGTDLTNTLSSVDLGDLGGGSLSGVGVTDSGRIAVVGTSNGTLSGGGAAQNGASGGFDAFVTTINDGGTLSAASTRYIGTSASDGSAGLAVSGEDIYVTGYTNDTLAGETRSGARDAFVAKIDTSDNSLTSLEQFGAFGGQTNAAGIAVSNAGESVLGKLGLRAGTINETETRRLGTQTSLNDGDFFYIAVDGKQPRKITIDESDSFKTIAAKINTLSFRSIEASVTGGSDGDTLKITAINDGRIEILAGDKGQNALVALGLEPQKIISSDILFAKDEDDPRPPQEQLGGIFALSLDDSFNLRDKTTAKYVLSKLDTAISTVQRAFRSLTFDPIAFQLKEQARLSGGGGQASTRVTKQLANYQDALQRLTGSSQVSSGFSI